MSDLQFTDQNNLRAAFSSAMSKMYREEVPAYGILMDLVTEVNAKTLKSDHTLANSLRATGGLNRISDERHGAIRVGTVNELKIIRRVFALMGMFPVGYYDLSVAGIPVHSTAFRPIDHDALSHNPFRVFTSLLRLDLIDNEVMKTEAEAILAERHIFSDASIEMIDKAEADGGVLSSDADLFIQEVLKTFKWHAQANVSQELYHRLHDAHRLIADIVSFKGPHINHLTPRTLDIDQVQELMPSRSINPKAVIEGPPNRNCPILLRQTSFKAIEEDVDFIDVTGGKHTARFGEIEQRGVALTPKGRTLYDDLLTRTRKICTPLADGSNAKDYNQTLKDVFGEFPDDWNAMRAQELAYFTYQVTDLGTKQVVPSLDFEKLIKAGFIRFDPIIYEDFLPVSAAGIFQSNLGDNKAADITQNGNQTLFENQLGAAVLDEFEHYARIEVNSKTMCMKHFEVL